MQTPSFEADEQVAEVARAYAQDLVAMARSQYAVELDYSLDSVASVERIAGDIAGSKPRFARFRPSAQAKLEGFSKMLGFYLAEVLQRHMAAEHGWVQMPDGQRFYGVRLSDGSLVWPVGRAIQRLMAGAENDLAVYVRALQGPPES